MNIYKELEYRKIVRLSLSQRRMTAGEAAEKVGVHGSYFSRVMKENAEFSAEQLFSLAKIFEFSPDETEYFLLLGEKSRSGVVSHQQFLKKQIEDIRGQKLKLKEDLKDATILETATPDYAQYYLEAMTARIHMYLCLDPYRLHPDRIREKLGITPEKLKEELNKLEALALIRTEGGQIRLLKDSVHLDEGDRLSPINHANWRIETVQRLARRQKRKDDYHCTANFTTNEEGQRAIKEAFKEFLLKAQKIVQGAGTEAGVYTLCFDIYED